MISFTAWWKTKATATPAELRQRAVPFQRRLGKLINLKKKVGPSRGSSSSAASTPTSSKSSGSPGSTRCSRFTPKSRPPSTSLRSSQSPADSSPRAVPGPTASRFRPPHRPYPPLDERPVRDPDDAAVSRAQSPRSRMLCCCSGWAISTRCSARMPSAARRCSGSTLTSRDKGPNAVPMAGVPPPRAGDVSGQAGRGRPARGRLRAGRGPQARQGARQARGRPGRHARAR